MARRPHVEPPLVGVHRVWPLLFWRLCRSCRVEFRREWGWSRDTANPFDHLGSIHHGSLCRDCAPSLESANQLFSQAKEPA